MCRFSIIIPIYNAQDFLNECLETILHQTYQSQYEIILVDDGSPDSSGMICDDYARKDSRIVVIHKENAGVAQARESGLAAAKGTYVLFVDSDDWVSPELLERLDKVITSCNPDIVCYGYYQSSPKGNTPYKENCHSGYYDKKKIESEIFPMLLQTPTAAYFTPSLWTKAIKREILKSIYPPKCTVKYGEDGMVSSVAIYSAQSMYVLEDCLYYYRINPNSATNKRYIMDWNEPRLRNQYFMQYINLNQHDFQAQLNRRTAHSLFNVALSRFNSNTTYCEISADIKSQLSIPDYKNAVENASFKGSIKAKLMEICLKHKIIPIMYLYFRIKTRGK